MRRTFLRIAGIVLLADAGLNGVLFAIWFARLDIPDPVQWGSTALVSGFLGWFLFSAAPER